MKRQENKTALKFKYIPQTETKSDRYRIIQTNTSKSVFIDAEFYDKTPLQAIEYLLENHPLILSYCLIIDNTQQDYFLFCVDNLSDTSFDDLLTYFKTL